MSYRGNIERLTLKINNYRKVLYTSKNMQLVVMSLKEDEEIGLEKHKDVSQFIRIEKGFATAIIKNKKNILKKEM